MRYIRISPIDAFFYDFMETPNGQYTAVKFWHDLSSLNGTIHNNLKLFVTHETSHDVISEPEMFIAAITEAKTLNEAVPILVNDIRNLLASLATHFSCGFKPIHERSFTIAANANHDFEINHIDLEISNNVISSIIFVDPSTIVEKEDGYELKGTRTKTMYALKGSVKHDDYINSYFSINHPDASNLNVNCVMLQPEKLQSIAELPDFETDHIFNTLLALYNDSLSCPIPSTAFSLLWQIIELIDSNADTTQLLNEDALNAIVTSLEGSNLDTEVIQNRILGSLKGMKAESQPERFITGIKMILPEWNAPENIKSIIRNARKARGKLYHPRVAGDPYDKELLKSYQEINDIVKTIVKSIIEKSSNKALQPTPKSGAPEL